MKTLISFTIRIAIFSFYSTHLFATENFAPESVEISKKIITINQEAMRAPASVTENESNNEEESLTDAMEKVEEPKLWFNP